MPPLSPDRAYVLHLRRYTDSRIILEFLTAHSGVVHAVARVPGKRDKAKFEAFQPLAIEFSGAAELKTLRVCEPLAESPLNLGGTALFCGLYTNELLQRLLRPGEPFSEIFNYYELAIQLLNISVTRSELESVLRRFEFFVLAQLGFGIDFTICGTSGEAVRSDQNYRYEQGKGFCAADTSSTRLIPGAHLLALAVGDLADAEVLKSAKYVSRHALAPLLGAQPLKSRELFI